MLGRRTAASLSPSRVPRVGRTLYGKFTDLGVTVRTGRATYRADHLVVCAGGWTGPLLGDVGVELAVTRQVFGWVWPRRP